MDLAIFLLRLVVGLLFVGHGTQKLFGWFGGPGLDGAEGMMQSLGYRPARGHAVLAGASEALGGLLLVLGLLTPFAAAALVGMMIAAIATVHAPNGPWIVDGGYEYNLVLIAAVFVIATGSAGIGAGLLALVIGAGAAGVALHYRRSDEATAGAGAEAEADERHEQRQAA